ncbi:MAG: helix-turn-helix domain-containing protein [Chloroflexi bacterium]|nr:helix-turn-helix domain-containing protein [Chloroflexota bacterium]
MFAKSPIEPNAIYSREETAQLLSISLSTLKQLIRTGQLKVSQPVGLRRMFIRGASILEMLQASERAPVQLAAADTRHWERAARSNGHSINSQGNSVRAKQTSPRRRVLGPSPRTVRASGGANR